MNGKKVAILVNTFYRGRGMDYVAEIQAKTLSSMGYEVSIITFEYDGHPVEYPVIEIGWPKNPFLNFIYRILVILDLKKVFSTVSLLKEYDVIISHFYPIRIFGTITKLKRPSVVHIYYDHGWPKKIPSQNLLRKIYIKILRSIDYLVNLQNSDYVISISHFLKRDTIETSKLHGKPAIVIYNTIDLSRFKNDNNPNMHKEKSMVASIIQKGAPLFLYVGVVNSIRKRVNYLINIFSKHIRDIYPSAKLIIVGSLDVDFKPELLKTKRVIYLGRISDTTLKQIYRICNVYVTATSWESFNLPAVEAQIFGLPVVAFDIGAHKEIILHNKSGYLVPFDDWKSFVEYATRAYESHLKMGRKARVWALKRFETNNYYHIMLKKYKKVLGHGDITK